MLLLPIEFDELQNIKFRENPECELILQAYPGYYKKVGFNKPWIGYFASINDGEIVGAGGFKGPPKNGKVEIAYGIFKKFERQGMGTKICRELVLLSLQADPAIRITARTLQDGIASIGILQKNGFEHMGIVYDEEDGPVIEWEFKNLQV